MANRTKEKFENLKGMNELVKSMNNEDAYMTWIYIIPDEVDDDELMDIAENDEEIFEDAVKCFKRIMKRYIEDGLYIGGKLY